MGTLKDNNLVYKPSGGMFVKPADVEASGRLIDITGAYEEIDPEYGEKVIFNCVYSDDEEEEAFRVSLPANEYRRMFVAHFENGRGTLNNIRLHKIGKVWVIEDSE